MILEKQLWIGNILNIRHVFAVIAHNINNELNNLNFPKTWTIVSRIATALSYTDDPARNIEKMWKCFFLIASIVKI